MCYPPSELQGTPGEMAHGFQTGKAACAFQPAAQLRQEETSRTDRARGEGVAASVNHQFQEKGWDGPDLQCSLISMV